MKAKIVDNGKCFGNDHWYSFHCGQCGRAIDMIYLKKDRLICEYCKEPIEYKEDIKENVINKEA